MEKLIVEIPSKALVVRLVQCPSGHSLMSPEVKFGVEPAIGMTITDGILTGEVHFSPCYGEFEVHSTIPLEEGKVFSFLCPDCGISLAVKDDLCSFCNAPMIGLNIPRGGHVAFCSRKGCHNHRLELVDLGTQLAALFQDELKPRF